VRLLVYSLWRYFWDGMRTYVVPVSLSLLQSLSLELEASDPATGLLGVLGKRKLTLVAVP
jgi:hypothetical protein